MLQNEKDAERGIFKDKMQFRMVHQVMHFGREKQKGTRFDITFCATDGEEVPAPIALRASDLETAQVGST